MGTWAACHDGFAAPNLKNERINTMKTKAIFYHAGCPICVEAEQSLASALDSDRYSIEIVHLGEARDRVAEAESAGVKSVPALLLGEQVFHINFGAALEDLRSAGGVSV